MNSCTRDALDGFSFRWARDFAPVHGAKREPRPHSRSRRRGSRGFGWHLDLRLFRKIQENRVEWKCRRVRSGILINEREQHLLEAIMLPKQVAGLVRYRQAVLERFDALAATQLTEIREQAEGRRRTIWKTLRDYENQRDNQRAQVSA